MSSEQSTARQELYQPRSAEAAAYYIDQITKPPELPLAQEQEERVLQFESDLMDGKYQAPDGSHMRVASAEDSLSEIAKTTRYKDLRCEICLDYFLTEDGLGRLKSLGLELEDPTDINAISTFIRRHALDFPEGTLKELQKASGEYSDGLIAQALVDAKEIDPPSRIVVFSNITPLMRRATGLSSYKRFFVDTARSLDAEPDDKAQDREILAQKAIVKIYRKRVNGLLAELEPDLVDLWEQVGQMDEPRRVILKDSLSIAWPLVAKLRLEEGSDSSARLAVRLDRLRNGASLREGRISVISQELDQYFDKPHDQPDHEDDLQSLFGENEIAKLSVIKLNAEQMQNLCKELLAKFGKLSSSPETEFYRDRPGRAPDGKWQVPISQEVKSMEAIDPPAGWVIPAKFDRNITKIAPPVGVASGVAHEFYHVSQNDNVRNNPKSLRISKEQLRGRGAGVVKEAGAKYAEAEIQKRLFGQSRSSKSPYLIAMQVLEQGGNEIDAARAYYESARKTAESDKAAASSAVGGTKRLARNKGGFNSEALNYAETALLLSQTENMPEEVKRTIFAEGSYSLQDMAELHKFGLLEFPPEPLSIDKVVSFLKEKLDEMLQNTPAG